MYDQKQELLLASYQQKDKARKIINRSALYAVAIGFVPLPLIDMASVTGVQLWMIKDLAAVYGVPFRKHRTKSLISSLTGNLGTLGIVKAVPIIGTILGGYLFAAGAGASTYALGWVFVEHFNQGGALLDFDPVKSRAYFQQLYREKRAAAQRTQEKKEEANLKIHEEFLERLQGLQKENEKLLTELELYEELHQEAEQIIKELHEVLSEQEYHFFEKQARDATLIADLEKTIQNSWLPLPFFRKRL